MRVLFVSPYVPSLVRIRPFHWIRALHALGHEVHLVALMTDAEDRAAVDLVRPYCTTVTLHEMPRWQPLVNCLRAVPQGEPFHLAWSRHDGMAAELRTLAARKAFDIAHIEDLRAACFAASLSSLPIVYDAVNSTAMLFEQTRRAGPRRADRWRARIDLGRTQRFERQMLNGFERVLVSSPLDAIRLRDQADTADLAARLMVLPSPVDLEHFRPGTGHREPATLIFTGTLNGHANVAAVERLLRRIMPRVWQQRADVQLLIVGQAPSAEVKAMAGDPRVTVTGYVPDLRPSLARATLAVCPMTYGVGIRNKVLEAMAAGVPVLASHRAVEALNAEPGRDLAVADSVEDFVTAILRLLASPSDRSFLAARGRAYVAAHHMSSVLGRRLEAAYRQAIHARRERS
jgi:glycosyltransferase involved in cell wall biosynthesis